MFTVECMVRLALQLHTLSELPQNKSENWILYNKLTKDSHGKMSYLPNPVTTESTSAGSAAACLWFIGGNQFVKL